MRSAVPGRVAPSGQSVRYEEEAVGAVTAIKEIEDGETYYTITIEHNKHTVYVSFTPRGKLTEINTELPIGELPKAITLSLQKKHPGSMLDEAMETIDVADGHKRTFTVTLKTAEKKNLEVVLNSNGSILKEEEVKDEPKKK